MNICEKINFIKQANTFFNFELDKLYSTSWRTVASSLTADEIASDEFNEFLLDIVNLKSIAAREFKIPDDDADRELKKAIVFNYFCILHSTYFRGGCYNEDEYYSGEFHEIYNNSYIYNIPTKSYAKAIEKFVNNIVKLSNGGLLSEIRSISSSNRCDILSYLDLWSRRFGNDREVKILDFIIDNGLSKYFVSDENENRFAYIDKLLSIICTSHPLALQIKEKVENDPYLKNTFKKYDLIISNPNLAESEFKFTQKNLSKNVLTILENRDTDALITLLDSVEKTYGNNKVRINRIQETILSKVLKYKKYDRPLADYFPNFKKLLNPEKPYRAILEKLVCLSLKNVNKPYRYSIRNSAEDQIYAIFSDATILKKIEVYNLYTNAFGGYLRSFVSLFYAKDDNILVLNEVLSEWNKMRKSNTLTEDIEKSFFGLYEKIIEGDSSYYYCSNSSSRLIGNIYNHSLYDVAINKFIIYYFLIKNNQDFLDLYEYYKENKRIPSLVRYLEKEYESYIHKDTRCNILKNNSTSTSDYSVFSNIFIVTFLCMFKKLLSEKEGFNNLYDPLKSYICFNPKLNQDALDIAKKTDSKYQLAKTIKQVTGSTVALTTDVILLSRDYKTDQELENEIIKEENEKIIASSHLPIITEDGTPVYRFDESLNGFSKFFVEQMNNNKSLYGENYKIETLKILLDAVFDYLFNGEYIDYILKNAAEINSFYKSINQVFPYNKDLVTALKEYTHDLNVDYLVDTYSKFFDIDKTVYNEKALIKSIEDCSTVLGLVENTNAV